MSPPSLGTPSTGSSSLEPPSGADGASSKISMSMPATATRAAAGVDACLLAHGEKAKKLIFLKKHLFFPEINI